jgi:hypothetical protein
MGWVVAAYFIKIHSLSERSFRYLNNDLLCHESLGWPQKQVTGRLNAPQCNSSNLITNQHHPEHPETAIRSSLIRNRIPSV